MKKLSAFTFKHLSAIIFIIIYLITVGRHVVSDNFLPSDQLFILLAILPCMLYGIALDFIMNRDNVLSRGYHILIAALPAGIFLLQIPSDILLYYNIDDYDILSYLMWIFLSLPLFLISFHKEDLRQRTIRCLKGLVAIIAVYMFLTTQTSELNFIPGAVLYFLTYFFLLFAASGIRKAPYLGTVLGILNAIVLMIMRYYPFTPDARANGWDYYFMYQMEELILITLAICIVIRLFETIIAKHVSDD